MNYKIAIAFLIISNLSVALSENNSSSTTQQPSPSSSTAVPSTITPEASENVDSTSEKEVVVSFSTTTTPDPKNLLIPPANVESQIAKMNSTQAKNNITKVIAAVAEGCPSFENAESLTQTQLFKSLVHPCRFDRIQRPEPRDDDGNVQPVNVYARAYIYFLQNLEAHDLQFKIQALLQLRYVDPRLVFKEVAPNRTQSIVGEDDLRKQLWVPHIFFANERDSGILGTHEKDILTSISPDGTVIISTRIQATLYCSMDLRKFPFDQQQCKTVLESWMYNASEVILHWEPKSPVTMGPDQHLTEYVLTKFFTNESMINADLNDLRHGAFAGNYSSLSFTVVLARQMGFYLLDYFLPSMMIVAISWVSFWLQADQSAPRIMLGTSTMLTFITLASAQGKTLPKVSYIKASEIWFMGCTGFIFGSLVEFAFVNTIWRRKRDVELKKVNSKYILKSTLTPKLARKELGLNNGSNLQKSHSCSSLNDTNQSTIQSNGFYRNNNLTVHGAIPIIKTESFDDFTYTNEGFKKDKEGSRTNSQVSINIEVPQEQQKDQKVTWTTMTPQQISSWIDKRSRFVFPIAFLIFNIFYWAFVSTI